MSRSTSPTELPLADASFRRRGRLLGTLNCCALILGPLVLGVVGCTKSESDAAPPTPDALTHGLTEDQANQVLAQVGDTQITLGQFAERLARQSPYLQARYSSPERRREFLDNMVRFELLATEAVRKGYDKTEEVQRIRKQMMVQQMMKELFQDDDQRAEVSEQDIQAFYDAHPEEFNKPEQVRISHILVKNRALGERLLKQLKANPDDMERFRSLAQEHNQDPASRDSLGDLRFISRPTERIPGETSVPDEVANVAFGLRAIGELHPELVSSSDGFHIVKLTARREPLRRSLDEARRMIQSRLWRERREQKVERFVASLRDQANIREDMALLEAVAVDPDAPAAGQRDDEANQAAEASQAAAPQRPLPQPAPIR